MVQQQIALIRTAPEAIVALYPAGVGRIQIPGGEQTWVHAPSAGWSGHGYRIADVVVPTLLDGKQTSAAVALIDGVPTFGLEDIPPEPRRRVDKGLIAERIEAAGKSDAAYELLTMPGNRGAFIKWNMPIESVYFDDAATLAMLEALELDPEAIMAPSA